MAPVSFQPYVLSGAQGRVLAMPLVGVPIAALLGGAYGWLHANTPCIGYRPHFLVAWFIVRVVLLLGCGHTIGWAAGHAGRWLAVRDVATQRLFGGAVGALAIWFAWIVHLWTLDTLLAPGDARPLLGWLVEPAAVWTSIVHLGENGLHVLGLGIDGIVPTRSELWLPWAAEAVAVVVLAARAAPWWLRNHAWCETCHCWLRREAPLELESPTSPREVRRHGLATMTEAHPPAFDTDAWTRIRLQQCPSCAMAVFQIELVLRTRQHGFGAGLGLTPSLSLVFAPLTARFEVEDGEVIVPWSHASTEERRELDRIEALVHDPATAEP